MRKEVPEKFTDLTPKQFNILKWVLNKIWESKVGGYSIVLSGFNKSVLVKEDSSIQSELIKMRNNIDAVFNSCYQYMGRLYQLFHPSYNNEALPYVITNGEETNGVMVTMPQMNNEILSATGCVECPSDRITTTQSLTIAYILGQLTNPSADVAFYLLDCPYLTKTDLSTLYKSKQIKSVKYTANTIKEKA